MEYKVIVNEDGTFWKYKGKFHREDGPAIEYADGDKRWYKNGELHREDGPAVVFADGEKQWYLNGEKLTEKEFLNRKPTEGDK